MSLVEQFSSSHDEVDFIALTSQCLLGIWHAIVVFRAVSLAELSPRWAGFVMFAQGDGVASTATRTCLSVSGNLFLLFFCSCAIYIASTFDHERRRIPATCSMRDDQVLSVIERCEPRGPWGH